MAPAIGVPNIAPNPPLSAAIRSTRRSVALMRMVRLNQSVRLPDIWMAVPSRPADPPNSWVTTLAP